MVSVKTIARKIDFSGIFIAESTDHFFNILNFSFTLFDTQIFKKIPCLGKNTFSDRLKIFHTLLEIQKIQTNNNAIRV